MPISVVELFAGVGGFRLGLEGFPKKENSRYDVVWSNQWEPSTKLQHANLVYKNRWPNSNHCDENIENVIENKFDEIPNHDLLVGGFPCQDYSVATTLKRSGGLEGKKGVLWWSIYNILKLKGENRPKYLFLENVDRLLTSPVKQRGRDFAVMLSCLYELGYAVEWRVINAAEYGMPQRRSRLYIVAFHKNTKLYKELVKEGSKKFLINKGIMAKSFPIISDDVEFQEGRILKTKKKVSEEFNIDNLIKPFYNAGIMINGKYITTQTSPNYEGREMVLRNILHKSKNMVPEEFYINHNKKLPQIIVKEQRNGKSIIIETEWDQWNYLKGSKKEWRYNKIGNFDYKYDEGKMVFPDKQSKPSRTIITGEGGLSASRFKHVIKQWNRFRRLTPIELERLNMFPDNHTKLKGITDAKRAFFMGNALVVGVIEKIGKELSKRIEYEN